MALIFTSGDLSAAPMWLPNPNMEWHSADHDPVSGDWIVHASASVRTIAERLPKGDYLIQTKTAASGRSIPQRDFARLFILGQIGTLAGSDLGSNQIAPTGEVFVVFKKDPALVDKTWAVLNRVRKSKPIHIDYATKVALFGIALFFFVAGVVALVAHLNS